MYIISLILGTLVLLSTFLHVSCGTETYNKNLDLNNKKEILLTGKSTEDSTLEVTAVKTLQDENNNLADLQKKEEVGRSDFFGTGLKQILADKGSTKSNSFNFALLNQLLTKNGLAALTNTSSLTTTILNQQLLGDDGQVEVGALNQILKELGVNPIPVPGNTLNRATQVRILEKLFIKGTGADADATDFDTLNECLVFIGLPKATDSGVLGRGKLRRILNRGGPINGATLDIFQTCLRVKPDTPPAITEIEPSMLSKMLDALRLPKE